MKERATRSEDDSDASKKHQESSAKRDVASSLRRSEMFIDRKLTITIRGSEGRNQTRKVLVNLGSAPPNRAGGFLAYEL